MLKVKLLSDAAVVPQRMSVSAAGYDLFACERADVPAGGRRLIDTGVAVALPHGSYGRVAPRSGLAVKHGITVGAGVIDADYRGPIKVLLMNHGDFTIKFHQGDRIAQLIIERILTPEVALVDDLDDTGRGDAGFGSTGA